MKLFKTFLVLLPFFSAVSAQAEVVYQCVDSSRTFTVDRAVNGDYTGTFQGFHGKPESYTCEHTGRGYHFQCTKGEYIVTVRRADQGGMMVDFELKGDFYPESGYLFALYCEK